MASMMIVDDYEIFRKQLKDLKCFKEHQDIHLLGEADNGADALRLLRKQPIDILLTDIKMPKLNGLELLEYVKQENLCKCVILLSEYADFEYARKGLVLGAFDYIIKPVKSNSLSKVLGRAKQFLEDEEMKQHEFNAECRILIESIIKSSSNFETQVKELIEKCFKSVEDDIVKGVVLLIDSLNEVVQGVTETYQWISMLVTAPEELCTRMLQADDKYMASALFENYMMELYVTVYNYYPENMSALSMKVADYILSHPYDRLTLMDTAEVCYVSHTYLSHRFKLDMGKSFVDYIVLLKMQIIKKMLTETEMSFLEIAEKLGYDDYKYMGRLFKKTYGFTLSDYRRMQSDQ